MNILQLVKRGCEFSPYDETVKGSDIGNYRVTTNDFSVLSKDGRKYHLEISHYDKWTTRRTNKRNGKPLARPVRELVANNVASVTACYFDEDGVCWGSSEISRRNHEHPRPYTEQGILDIVNSISAVRYDAIEYVSGRRKNFCISVTKRDSDGNGKRKAEPTKRAAIIQT